MSTLTLVPNKKARSAKPAALVQTFFEWDAPATPGAPPSSSLESSYSGLDEGTELRSLIAAKAQQQTLEFDGRTAGHHRAKSPVVRRGRDEHVGVALVSVLGKYGISLDDLLHEIERQKKEGA